MPSLPGKELGYYTLTYYYTNSGSPDDRVNTETVAPDLKTKSIIGSNFLGPCLQRQVCDHLC